MFSDGKSLVNVAIALDIGADEVLGIHNDYLRLLNLDSHDSTGIWMIMTNLLVYLYRQLKWEGLANRNDILNVV